MKLIVCGGREYSDKETLYKTLDIVHETNKVDLLLNGGARGADSLSTQWANDRGVTVKLFPAQWDIHGKSAGYIRNKEMAEYGADMCIAFPGGRGTANMIEQARRKGIETIKAGGIR